MIVLKQVIIGTDNGYLPIQHQASSAYDTVAPFFLKKERLCLC